MDFQAIVDCINTGACVISVATTNDRSNGEFRIVTGNSNFLNKVIKSISESKVHKLIPNSIYTDYLPRDLNFEESCYQSAVLNNCQHSYVHTSRNDLWYDMDFIPLSSDKELFYCLFIVEVKDKPDAKSMSSTSADIASYVLETCIKLQNPDDFKNAMKEVCTDIRDLC